MNIKKFKDSSTNFLSNIYTNKIKIDGKIYINIYHYIQTMKFTYKNIDKQQYLDEYIEILLECDNIEQIKCLSEFNIYCDNKLKIKDKFINEIIYKYKKFDLLDNEWFNKNKLTFMIRGLIYKFRDEKLKKMLINSVNDNEYIIYENNEPYWGGNNNYLGKILTIMCSILKYKICKKIEKIEKKDNKVDKYSDIYKIKKIIQDIVKNGYSDKVNKELKIITKNYTKEFWLKLFETLNKEEEYILFTLDIDELKPENLLDIKDNEFIYILRKKGATYDELERMLKKADTNKKKLIERYMVDLHI